MTTQPNNEVQWDCMDASIPVANDRPSEDHYIEDTTPFIADEIENLHAYLRSLSSLNE